MAILLHKVITREVTDWQHRGLFGLGATGKCLNLMISLEPGNIISFREKGRIKRYDIDIETVYNLARRRQVARECEAKAKQKKEALKKRHA